MKKTGLRVKGLLLGSEITGQHRACDLFSTSPLQWFSFSALICLSYVSYVTVILWNWCPVYRAWSRKEAPRVGSPQWSRKCKQAMPNSRSIETQGCPEGLLLLEAPYHMLSHTNDWNRSPFKDWNCADWRSLSNEPAIWKALSQHALEIWIKFTSAMPTSLLSGRRQFLK